MTINGHVKFYNTLKGYGILEGEDGRDYFVHASVLKSSKLFEGERVTFQAVEGSRGWQAIEIQRLEPPDLVYHFGEVLHLCEEKGYGFLRVEGRQLDLFFHFTDVEDALLSLGDRIVCQVRDDRKGRDRAYSIKIVKES
jgi:CspA family cold shock protein